MSYAYWGLGEEWERNTAELQNLRPRQCYVKNRITGAITCIRTAEIESPWHTLGMNESTYLKYLMTLPFGKKYLLERDQIENDIRERRRDLSVAPAGSTVEPSEDSQYEDTREPSQEETLVQEADHDLPNEQEVVIGEPLSTSSPVQKIAIDYLEHAARHPFMTVSLRNKALNLSKYKGSTARQQLIESGWVIPHKVITGRRSGQPVLLEITVKGYEYLSSLKIRVEKPRGRGGFLHKYYAHKLREYAETTWPQCTAHIEDSSQGRPVDVSVRIPTDKGDQNLAFEVFMTGEAKEVKGIVQDVHLYDQVVVCAQDAGSLEHLKARVIGVLEAQMLEKVTFSLVSQYLILEDGTNINATPTKKRSSKISQQTKEEVLIPNNDQVLNPAPSLEKNPTRLEVEPERTTPSKKRRGRRPKTPLLEQIEDAYIHLHDLDWLQESELTQLAEVRERTNPRQIMPGRNP